MLTTGNENASAIRSVSQPRRSAPRGNVSARGDDPISATAWPNVSAVSMSCGRHSMLVPTISNNERNSHARMVDSHGAVHPRRAQL